MILSATAAGFELVDVSTLTCTGQALLEFHTSAAAVPLSDQDALISRSLKVYKGKIFLLVSL
jgi:hypothetical protein